MVLCINEIVPSHVVIRLNGRNFAFDCSGTSHKKQGIFLENQLFYELINWKRTKFQKDA